ncbi:transposase, partial [Niveibacterium sp. 24ML]|uniref:transposase n=1 Tax=Niveibacterium sp. 24ML TaxID=2985512 RepID=UPI002270975F
MTSTSSLDTLTEVQLRTLARELIAQVTLKQTTIEKLAHENALLKRLKFGARTESYSAEQRQLFEETFDADLAALEQEIRAASPAAAGEPRAA